MPMIMCWACKWYLMQFATQHENTPFAMNPTHSDVLSNDMCNGDHVKKPLLICVSEVSDPLLGMVLSSMIRDPEAACGSHVLLPQGCPAYLPYMVSPVKHPMSLTQSRKEETTKHHYQAS